MGTRELLQDVGYPQDATSGDGELYDVAVWNREGDIVKKFWCVTYEGAEKIREQYADEPLLTVVVEEC